MINRALAMSTVLLAGCTSAVAPDLAPARTIDVPTLLGLAEALSADEMEGRAPGTAGHAAAQALIVKRMTDIGLEPVGADGFAHTFIFGGFADRRGNNALPQLDGANYVGRIPGTSQSDLTLIITAHYDHVGIIDDEIYNGADDNASGVAAILAIAEAFAAQPPKHDILFVAFDAEEEGFYGSLNFMSSPPVPLDAMAMNLNLDMVSRQDGGELWASGANYTPILRPLIQTVAETAPISLQQGYDGTDPDKPDWTNMSDQVAFVKFGIPHLYLGVEDHADYHEPGDDFEKVDPAFYAGSVETALRVAESLDRELDAIYASRR